MSCSAEDFEWLTAREAVLHRPDAYVGSLEKVEEAVYVCGRDGIFRSEVHSISPIFMKIFDEVLVNALDCCTRDALVSKITCGYSEYTGTIFVENDGAGIPIEYFKNTNRYIPSVVFSEIHAGSNFKDEEARLTGGRNGVGVSCTNIWSSLFEVSVSSGKKCFFQRFSCNLQVIEEPQVGPYQKKGGHVKVTYVPDYARLGIDVGEATSYLENMLRARCEEAAFCVRSGVKVIFNSQTLVNCGGSFLCKLTDSEKSIQEQFGLEGDSHCIVWLAPRKTSGVDTWGFVNGIRCCNGTLASHVRDKLLRFLSEHIKKKHSITLRAQTLRDVLSILYVARIVNPCFTSQAKSVLSTPPRNFSFAIDFSARTFAKLQKLGLIDELVSRETNREFNASLKKTLAPKTRDVFVEKYDAALRCRSDPSKCTLILTEGDSAKAFVVGGLSVIGRDYYGVFPLRGVPLNVSNLSVKRILENAEMSNIFRILNTHPLSDGSAMRYGKVAICSDQDSDGAHICGLLINMFMRCLPEVIANRPDFIQRIVTPLIKASPKRSGGAELCFHSIQQFNAWKLTNNHKDWEYKYYKGLGTSSSKEARQIFQHLSTHTVDLIADDDASGTLCKFYDESHVAERKRLLTVDYSPSLTVDYSCSSCTITDFMLREHLHFSHYSTFRALPSAIDGLTPSRRKVLYYFLTSARSGEIKVAQASAGVAQKTLYLHGENSLVDTIVSLAQDHVGTNNIALLEPIGQFGSRNDKPSVHAAARYIFTKLDPITSALFPSTDSPVLTYREEEGQKVEPIHFVPVLPLLLINGAQGIGTGFSTSVPSYHVQSLCACVRAYISKTEMPNIAPFFRSFEGSVTCTDKAVISSGVLTRVDPCTWLISELPVGKWTEPFLTELKAYAEGTRVCKGVRVQSIINVSTEHRVNIEIILSESSIDATAEEVSRALRLTTTIATNNMHAFDGDYTLKLYPSTHSIFLDYAEERMKLYAQRRLYQLGEMETKQSRLSARRVFIDLVISGELSLNGVSRAALVAKLESHDLPRFPASTDAEGYDYLLHLSVISFTSEKVKTLNDECDQLRVAIDALKAMDASEMWLRDLQEFEEAYAKYEQRLAIRHGGDIAPPNTTTGRRTIKPRAKAKPHAAKRPKRA